MASQISLHGMGLAGVGSFDVTWESRSAHPSDLYRLYVVATPCMVCFLLVLGVVCALRQFMGFSFWILLFFLYLCARGHALFVRGE